ncbi:hypothetical protein D3C73_1545430 [compost metagenome]
MRPGTTSGNTMRNMVPVRERPSTLAASRMSSGRASMMPFSRNTASGRVNVVNEMISAV